MNRTILFRGKRIDNGEWVCGFLTCMNYIDVFTQKVCYDGQEELNYCTVEHCQVDKNTVGQFTGLCDKNGNKIFEGDIVKVTYTEQRQYQGVSYQDEHSCVEEVIYNEKSACFMLKVMCEDIPLYRPLHNFGSLADIKELEVIGNIYDNPELLEVEQ